MQTTKRLFTLTLAAALLLSANAAALFGKKKEAPKPVSYTHLQALMTLPSFVKNSCAGGVRNANCMGVITAA